MKGWDGTRGSRGYGSEGEGNNRAIGVIINSDAMNVMTCQSECNDMPK